MLLLVELSAIVSKHKQLDRTAQRIGTSRKTTRPPSQACQIMAQISIGTFYGIGLACVWHGMMDTGPVQNSLVAFVIVTIVIVSLDTFSQHFLELCATTLFAHSPGQNAACLAVHKGQDVDPVFLLAMNVYSSSISTSSTSAGSGASGN